MKNLKITFSLKDGAILNRFTTIDSILLVHHYALQRELGNIPKNKFIETKDDLENLSKWIEVKNNVLSGSIWYVEEDSYVSLWNIAVRKRVDVNAIFENTGRSVVSASKPTPSSGEFKAYDLPYEVIKVDKIHFYIKGDLAYIEKLLKKVKYIGAKSSSGNGWVKDYKIEEIAIDKSFMIDKYTPAKPLPSNRFRVESKKVAVFRTLPPYSDKKDKEYCYMPTTSLIERSDNTRLNSAFKVWEGASFDEVFKFIATDTNIPCQFEKRVPLINTEFLYKNLGTNTKFNFETYQASKGLSKINNESQTSESLFDDTKKRGVCACCGKEFTVGVIGDIKKVFPATFNDFPSIGKEDGVCRECLWSITDESCKTIDFSFVQNNKIEYLYGGKMSIAGTKPQSLFRKEFVSNLDLLDVPYSININTNKGKPNHIGFKGNVTVSNAYSVFNFGDRGSEFVDVELLKEAINDMIDIMSKTKTTKKADSGLKKTHLLNFEDYKGNFSITKELDTMENRKLLSDFYKKYDSSIRRILHIIVF